MGLGLRDLRRLRTLRDLQPGRSLCFYPMAGSSAGADIAIHRHCMRRNWRGSGSLRACWPGPTIGLEGPRAVAICSHVLCARFESIFCWGASFGLRIGSERSTMKDDLDDVPVVYLLYVLLSILLMITAAVIVIARML
jgi:hypothetical protein